jgi:hypothetical protein
MTGCGGGSGGTRTEGSVDSSSTAGEAQGVYSGTSQGGNTFEAIVLPNDKFYALHGITSGGTFFMDGMMAGQGASDHGTFKATVTDYTSLPISGTLTATYVPGTSIAGTITGAGISMPFTATVMPSFNFNTAAHISDITGNWTAMLMDATSAVGTITSDGNFSAITAGCTISGKFTPDTAKNFFNVSLTFGASPCLLPNQTANGAAVYYPVPNGTTHQLVMAGVSGSFGTAIVATR